MIAWLAFAAGTAVGIAFKTWHERSCRLEADERVVVRKFEFHS